MKTRGRFLRIRIPLIIILVVGLIFLEVFRFFGSLGVGNIYNLVYNFIAAPVGKIATEHDHSRINILVMGKAGGAHDGPDLTDTMMLVSLGLTKRSISIISIPRDLWMPTIRAKINSAYYWGKTGSEFVDSSSSGGGIGFAKETAGKVIGRPIQYGMVIDFSAFKDVIDALGGIRVDAAQSFTDKLYPIAGKENDTCGGDHTFACRYETVSFNAGPQIMNGDMALIFVRSRYAEGIEGTDQAREARQQKVIDAIKNRLMDPIVFLSPKIDMALIAIVQKYVETDIGPKTAAVLARVVLNDAKLVNQYLIPSDLLVNPPITSTYDKQYVLVPKAGNGKWTQINEWFASVLN